MSMEKKKDTCAGPKGKKGKRKQKDEIDDEEENREMILGEEHWKRWQERNKTPFVSFTFFVELFAPELTGEKKALKPFIFPIISCKIWALKVLSDKII